MSKVGKVIQTNEQKSSVQICKGFFKKKDAQKNSVQNSVTVFKCDVCNYSTKYNINSKKHFRTVHENEKKFKCEICQSCFEQSGHLKTHIKTGHKNEKRKIQC